MPKCNFNKVAKPWHIFFEFYFFFFFFWSCMYLKRKISNINPFLMTKKFKSQKFLTWLTWLLCILHRALQHSSWRLSSACLCSDMVFQQWEVANQYQLLVGHTINLKSSLYSKPVSAFSWSHHQFEVFFV